MNRARRAGYSVLALGLAIAACGCDPWDPLCDIYFTPECVPDEPDEPWCGCADGSLVPDCSMCPPPPEVICICPDDSVVPDCGMCPPLPPVVVPGTRTICPDGSVVIDGEACPIYVCPDGSIAFVPEACPGDYGGDPGGPGGGDDPSPEAPPCSGPGQELYLGEYCICLPRWTQDENGNCSPPPFPPIPDGVPPPQRPECIETYQSDMQFAGEEWNGCMQPILNPEPGPRESDDLSPNDRIRFCDTKYRDRAEQARQAFFACDQAQP
jgi:hypothetical protein